MEHVCRTCLRVIGYDNEVTNLNEPPQEFETVTVRQKLEACVPELTVDIVLEPTICTTCTAALTLAYQFKSTCLETEKTLFRCIQRRNCTDLLTAQDLLVLTRKDINEEHNYSFVQKVKEYISDNESENEFSVRLPTVVRASLSAFVENAAEKKTVIPEEVAAKEKDATEARSDDKETEQSSIKKENRRARRKRFVSKTKPDLRQSSLRRLKKVKVTKDEYKKVEVLRDVKRPNSIHKDDSQASNDEKSSTKITSPAKSNRIEERKEQNEEEENRNESVIKNNEVQFNVKDSGSFSTVSSCASVRAFVEEVINTFEEKEKKIVTVKDSKQKERSVTPEKSIECASVKRKQRKQSKPKKKPIEQNNEDDQLKVVTYPELLKSPSHKINNEAKQMHVSDTINNGIITNEDKDISNSQKRSSRDESPRKKTIKRELEPNNTPPKVRIESEDKNHHNGDCDEEDNNHKKSKKDSSNVLLNKDENTKVNYNGADYDGPRLREEVVVKSDIMESLTPVWYTSEDKKFQCTKCSKGYNYKCHFDVHLKSHIFKKLYSCPMCEKSFTQEKYLKSHAMTHANTGLYQCEICLKFLSASTALKRHIRTHTGEKPYPCATCSKRFAQKIQLAVHMRTHTGTRPFSCNTCNASFTQKSHLLGHVRTHTGEKPFACDICPKRFRKSYALQVHRECHILKPYQCNGCNIMFKERGVYHRHMNKYLPNCVRGRAMLKSKISKLSNDMVLNGIEQDIRDINQSLDVTEELRKPHLFYCKICNRGFSTKFSRNRHMKIHKISS